jgi:Fe-S-cluster-containing hydrogenase component 2
MSKIITVNPEKCTNCKMCEMACSFKKTDSFSPLKSRIRVNVFAAEFSHIPVTCFQCADAPCVKVCPAGALLQGEGLVRFVQEACIGCKMCMLACPFGVISFDEEVGRIYKCDTCDGDPECVRFCPFDALEYRESDLASATKGRDFARKVMESAKG